MALNLLNPLELSVSLFITAIPSVVVANSNIMISTLVFLVLFASFERIATLVVAILGFLLLSVVFKF